MNSEIASEEGKYNYLIRSTMMEVCPEPSVFSVAVEKLKN
jgi:hypothetical protein